MKRSVAAAAVAWALVISACVSHGDLLVPIPAPSAASVAPTAGSQGTTITATVTGANFIQGATSVSVSGSGVTVSNVVVASDGLSVTASFTIDAAAPLGAHTVTVTTAAGSVTAPSFTINPPAPTLASVTPNAGAQQATVAVTLAGTNLIVGATTVSVAGTGVTVSNVSVSSGTSLTANFVIASAATLGAHNVSVATAGGASAALPFTVNPPIPVLASITPNGGLPGTIVSATLTGLNFVVGATSVAVGGVGVTVSNVAVTSSTTISVTFTVAVGAALGGRSVTVTTAGGTSGAQQFNIVPLGPTLVSVLPNTGGQGTTVPVTLVGTNFVIGGTTVAVSGGDVSTTSVTVTGDTTLNASFVIAANAVLGAHNVTVITAGGTTAAVAFTVTLPTPKLISVGPPFGSAGLTVPVTLTGSNFVPGTTSVAVSGTGITVNSIVVAPDSLSLTASLVIDPNASIGTRNVTVTTASGTSNTRPFAVAALIFVSSTSQNGNLGGLAGADVTCVNLATAAVRPGSFKAWLGDGTTSAAARLTQSSGPYLRADGGIVANNWADLTGGAIRNVLLTETGVGTGGAKAYTNTMIDGSAGGTTAGAHCTGWTSNSNGVSGNTGQPGGFTNSAWTQGTISTCDIALRLVCLQQ